MDKKAKKSSHRVMPFRKTRSQQQALARPIFTDTFSAESLIQVLMDIGSHVKVPSANPIKSGQLNNNKKTKTFEELWKKETLIQKDIEKEKPFPSHVSEFPFPLYHLRNYRVSDLKRESVLRTKYSEYLKSWFSDYLSESQAAQEEDPNFISWTLQYDGTMIVQPQQINDSVEAFRNMNEQTEEDTLMVFEYAQNLQFFLKNVFCRAITEMFEKRCITTDGEIISLFDDSEEVVEFFSSSTSRHLNLFDMEKILTKLFSTLKGSLVEGLVLPPFPDFRKVMKNNVVPYPCVQRKHESIPINLKSLANNFEARALYKKFDGKPSDHPGARANGCELSVKDLFGFLPNNYLSDNAIDTLLLIIGDNAVGKACCEESVNFYTFSIVETFILFEDPKVTKLHLENIKERLNVYKTWLARDKAKKKKMQMKMEDFDDPKKTLEREAEKRKHWTFTTPEDTFSVIFPIRWSDGHTILIVANILGKRQIHVFDPKVSNKNVALDRPNIRSKLEKIKDFFGNVIRQPFENEDGFFHVPFFFVAKQRFPGDSGIWITLLYEQILQGEATFRNNHDMKFLALRNVDVQRMEYLNYIIDRYQGSFEMRSRDLWEAPKEIDFDPDMDGLDNRLSLSRIFEEPLPQYLSDSDSDE